MTLLADYTLDTIDETEETALDIERQIGNTPLLNFRRVTSHLPANVRILAKAEWQNPGGSVKDRAAYEIIRSAEADGRLVPGKTILDSTSGNTGIAYAMIAAAKGYRVKLVLAGKCQRVNAFPSCAPTMSTWFSPTRWKARTAPSAPCANWR